eukprot:scaffold368658_cov21-Prasinocladus_malaysianus.AAC.1
MQPPHVVYITNRTCCDDMLLPVRAVYIIHDFTSAGCLSSNQSSSNKLECNQGCYIMYPDDADGQLVDY